MKKLTLLLLITIPLMALGKGIVFITHSTTSVSSLSRAQIRDFYFKKNRNWNDGTSVRFFDRTESYLGRKIFVSEILKRTPRQVDRYWIEQKFKSGDTAPSEVDGDQILIDLISRFPGSISYLTDDVTLPKSVKVIEVNGQ